MGIFNKDAPRAWVLENGRFVELVPPERCPDCGEYHPPHELADEEAEDPFYDDEDEDDLPPLLVHDQEEWATCPYCDEPMRKGDISLLLTRWVPLQKGRRRPLVPVNKYAHISCLLRHFRKRLKNSVKRMVRQVLE